MKRIGIGVALGWLASTALGLEVVENAVEDVTEKVDQCEQLYEDIRTSECTKAILDIVGKAYIKVGVSFTERQLKFENTEEKKKAFVLSSGFKPRPIFTVALSDSYIWESNWGYSVGFSYFDDYAFEQIIERGSEKRQVDLGTYSTMNVIAVSPSMFYSWGRQDDNKRTFGKAGVGINFLHSHVRGTAYSTELKSDTACYDAGTNLVEKSGSREDVRNACTQLQYEESSFGTGIKIFIAGEWHLWEVEFSISQFGQKDGDEYKFNTQEAVLGFAKKFEF